MTDWAEEKAYWLCGMSVCAGEPHHIATALRKAKAECYLEVAKHYAENADWSRAQQQLGIEWGKLDEAAVWGERVSWYTSGATLWRMKAAEKEGKTDGQQ